MKSEQRRIVRAEKNCWEMSEGTALIRSISSRKEKATLASNQKRQKYQLIELELGPIPVTVIKLSEPYSGEQKEYKKVLFFEIEGIFHLAAAFLFMLLKYTKLSEIAPPHQKA